MGQSSQSHQSRTKPCFLLSPLSLFITCYLSSQWSRVAMMERWYCGQPHHPLRAACKLVPARYALFAVMMTLSKRSPSQYLTHLSPLPRVPSFPQSSHIVASGGLDGRLVVWNLSPHLSQSSPDMATLPSAASSSRSVKPSPLSAVYLNYGAPKESVYSLDLRPDGALVVAGGSDGMMDVGVHSSSHRVRDLPRL